LTAILFAIGFGMFLLNLFQHVYNLMIVTGIFSAMCVVSFIILIVFHKDTFASYVISISTAAMLISFLINGGIDGFSPIWACLLPSVAMFFLGMKRGAILSLTMLVILLLCFWTPLSGLLLYKYNKTFMTRFPIVYFSSFLMALALEYVRRSTYNKMRSTMDMLDKLGKIDPLTQIENRRFFDLKLVELWGIILRANGKISMLMIDVDCFKSYNDKYGHMAGDKVLVEVAKTINTAINRKTDFAARWGGEEFAVLLPLTDQNGAKKVAERIRKKVREKNIPHEYTNTLEKFITVSIGIATVSPSKFNSYYDLLKLSDDSLYQAKSDGKNQTGKAIGLAEVK
jgi:diguanylate cyclase (GGDEF)-like protein